MNRPHPENDVEQVPDSGAPDIAPVGPDLPNPREGQDPETSQPVSEPAADEVLPDDPDIAGEQGSGRPS